MGVKRLAYPIVLTAEPDGGYLVYIPDFDTNTEGEDLADALFMARDAIGILGMSYNDMQREIPMPSNIDHIDCEKECIKLLIDVDFDEYRRKHDSRLVKKTLTIPSWINERAIEQNINFSSVLQNALIAKLELDTQSK